jgi:hypothetical protein
VRGSANGPAIPSQVTGPTGLSRESDHGHGRRVSSRAPFIEVSNTRER